MSAPAAATRGRPVRQRGLAVVEFAVVAMLMFVMLFAIIDLGRAILTRQVLINVSREAANLSSRGTSFTDTLSAALISAAPLQMNSYGYVILSQVVSSPTGVVTIQARSVAGGKPQASKIGAGVGSPAVLPTTTPVMPPVGQSLFVAEVYYLSPPITPLGALINTTFGGLYYDVAFF